MNYASNLCWYTSLAEQLTGPVLLVFDMEAILLDQSLHGQVDAVKLDPVAWTGCHTDSDKYYQSEDEFSNTYTLGRLSTMFALRLAAGRLLLKPYLKEIIVDDPQTYSEAGQATYMLALNRLSDAMRIGGLHQVGLRRRQCKAGCLCVPFYQATKWWISKFFDA